jgi:hypothetical protein
MQTFLHEIEISSMASCPEIDKYLRLASMLLVRAKVDHLFWVTARFLQIFVLGFVLSRLSSSWFVRLPVSSQDLL